MRPGPLCFVERVIDGGSTRLLGLHSAANDGASTRGLLSPCRMSQPVLVSLCCGRREGRIYGEKAAMMMKTRRMEGSKCRCGRGKCQI